MNFKKKFLVFTSLFMILGSSLALATSEIPSTDISGEPSVSGDTSTEEPVVSGDLATSGDIISGDISSGEIISGDITSGDIASGDITSGDDSFINVLNSIALDSEFVIEKNDSLEAAFEVIVSGDETFNFIIITEPSHGIVSQETVSEPLFTYTPTTDYVGEDSFTFRLESGDFFSNVGTISITVRDSSEPVIPFYYEDMQEHWANYSASHLAARGINFGEEINDNFNYCPNKSMTRSEFLLFILSILDIDDSDAVTLEDISGDSTVSGDSTKVKFADEDEIPSWLLPKIELAYNMKIISGVSKDNSLYFKPNALITRGEAFVMINNALLMKTNSTNANEKIKYTDSENIPSWALQAIKTLSAYQIIQGDSNNAINTTKTTTRAEAAELCYKLLKQLELNDLNDSTNNSGDLK